VFLQDHADLPVVHLPGEFDMLSIHHGFTHSKSSRGHARWIIGACLLLNISHAANLSVGTGLSCTHTSMQAALDAIEGLSGDHAIKVQTSTYLVANGLEYKPTVAQGFVRIEGGYANCADLAPSGDPTTDAGRSIFDAAGGALRPVLELNIDSSVGSLQIRRIALQNGDASDGANPRYNAGGGLQVIGNASVLIGRGTTIRNNRAGRGAGVALIGSRVAVNEPIKRADFFITEGAEIRDNAAANIGGGIFCGGALDSSTTGVESRHASIVHINGNFIGNVGRFGSAIDCTGSYAGGGYQPKPEAGALIAFLQNRGVDNATVSCTVRASFDLVIPATPSGTRLYGAADGSNGLPLFVQNQNFGGAAWCVLGYENRAGASPRPPTPLRLQLQNAAFLNNTTEPLTSTGFAAAVALDVTPINADGTYFQLNLQPSAPKLDCSGVVSNCVEFSGNQAIGFPVADPVALIYGGVRLRQALIRDNQSNTSLILRRRNSFYQAPPVDIAGSLIHGNTILGTDPVVLDIDDDSTDPAVDLQFAHNTVTNNTHARYFRLDSSAIARVTGSVFNASPARLLRFGSAPGLNLILNGCVHVNSTSDTGYADAEKRDDLGPFALSTGVLSFTSNFAPPVGLRDQCRVPINTDFYGNDMNFNATNPPVLFRYGDLGAVEFYSENFFRNGFE
jgi:hypothetical protein